MILSEGASPSSPVAEDGLLKELVSLREAVNELSRASLSGRDSLAQTHQELDRSIKRLAEHKKVLSECRGDIKDLKKEEVNVSELESLLEQIDPIVQDLNQRTVPATGR